MGRIDLPRSVHNPHYAAGRCGDPAQRPWCDTAKSADERAGLLLAALTRDEKISLEFARREHAVVIDPVTFAVDSAATRAVRAGRT